MRRQLFYIFLVLILIKCTEDEEVPELTKVHEIFSFNPQYGLPNTSVEIMGENFGVNKEICVVKFGEVASLITSILDNKIVTTVPDGSASGTISVTINEVTRTTEEEFIVPSVSPTQGTIGTTLMIHGKYFGSSTNNVSVNIDGVSLPVQSVTDNQITAKIIAGVRSGLVQVTLSSSGTFVAGSFTLESLWSEQADLPGLDRSSTVAFSIGNKFYVGLGVNFGNTRTVYSDFWEYNPETNSWAQKASFPGGGRIGPVGFSIGPKGYVGVGYDDSPYSVRKKDFWEYNPQLDQWTRKFDFPGGERVGAVGFSVNGKGYVGLGSSSSSPFTVENDLWSFDPVTGNWAEETDFPGSSRSNLASFVIQDMAFVGAGVDQSETSLKDFYEYDPILQVWKPVASSPITFKYPICFSISGQGYVGIGSDNSAKIYVYDPLSNEWAQTESFPFAADIFAAYSTSGSLGNVGYLYFGQNPNTTKSFWRFN